MANRYDELISKLPKGSFYDAVGAVVPYRGNNPHEFLFSPVTASRAFGVYVNGQFRGETTSDANGRAVVRLVLAQGRQDIVLIDTTTQAQFPAFVDVRVLGTVMAAHADVFAGIDESVDDIQSALSLETASSRFIEDVYGRAVKQANDLGGWLTDSYRRLLRRLRQAFRVYGAKLLGVRQTVHAFTAALPLRVPRLWRSIWTLGYQLMPNGDLQAHTRLTVSPLTNLNLTGTGRARAFVHAAFGGVPTLFPGPFTNPPVAQALTVTFGAGWTGGSVGVTGTNASGSAVTDTISPTGAALPETVTGLVDFATVTAATKGAGAGGTASIGVATSRFINVVEFGGLNPPLARTLEYLVTPDRLRWATSGPTVDIATSGRYTLREADTPAIWFGLVFEPGGGYVVGDEHFLALECNGRGVVLVDLSSVLFGGGASPRTAAQVATSVNRYFTRETSYGAVKATGTITCIAAALIGAGETVSIPDGVNPNDGAPVAVVLRYRKSGSDGLGAVLRTDIDLVNDVPTATTVAALTANTINALGGDLRVSASAASGVVTLENDFGGTQGNAAITDTVANVGYVPAGMAGGVNSSFNTLAAGVASAPNALGTTLRFIVAGAGGPTSTFRIHAVGADGARTVLGEPRFAALLSAGAVARAVLLDVPVGARLPDVFEPVILHAASADTAGVVTVGFTQPARAEALEVYFDGAWRGGVLRVFGTDVLGVVQSEDFTPASQAVDSGLRAVSFDGTTVLLGGRGDNLTFAAGTVTLDDADGAFTPAMTGGEITIENATTAGNNGTFSPVTYVSATQITFPNASGVTEAFTGVYGLDRGELFEGVLTGMFFRRTDNGTGAFVRINDVVTVGGSGTSSYRLRLHAAVAGAPWGPVAWTVTKDVVTKGTKAFKTVTQMQAMTTPGAGTAGSATLSVIDGVLRGYSVRVGRNVRDFGAGGATFTITGFAGGTTAVFQDTAAAPAFLSELSDLTGWLLIQGATTDGGTNNGLHQIFSLGSTTSPGFGFLFIRHQDADRGGRFANETLPGGATWRIYNRGELVRVVGKDGAGDLVLYPPGLAMARALGDLVEVADELPFTEFGFEGPGTITVDVDRALLPTGAASDALTLSGTRVPDGWRALNAGSHLTAFPGHFGKSRHHLVGSGADSDAIGAQQAFQQALRTSDVLAYRGFRVRASFWLQQHTSASENIRIDFSFDGTVFTAGSAVTGGPANPQAVVGTFIAGAGSDGVRDPVVCQAEAEIPYNATTCIVRLVHMGVAAAPPPTAILSIEKCVVQIVNVTSTFLGANTMVFGEHRAKFGELLYVWSPTALSAAERTALGVPAMPVSVPTVEGQVDRIVNAHGYWERFDVSEYSSGVAVNLAGAYDEVGWLAATLTNMEISVGTPPRTTVVRPSKVSLVVGERLSITAPSNATLAETSAHEGAFPAESFTDERLYEDGLPVPATPSVGGGVLPWRFTAATTVQIASVAAGDPAAQAVYNAAAVYTVDYRRLIRVEVAAFDLGGSFADYLWLVDAAIYRRAEVSSASYVRTQQLVFLANLQAALGARGDQDQTTSTLVRDTGLERTTVPMSTWRYVDGLTVEIDADQFDPNSIYSLTYSALEPKYTRPATVVIEARSSSVSTADVAVQTYRTVTVDEVVNRAHRYHQLRVTIAGVVGGRVQSGAATGQVTDTRVTLSAGTFGAGVVEGMTFRVLSGGSAGKSAHIVSATTTTLVLDAGLGALGDIDWEVVTAPGGDLEIAGLGLRGIHLYGAAPVAPGIIV